MLPDKIVFDESIARIILEEIASKSDGKHPIDTISISTAITLQVAIFHRNKLIDAGHLIVHGNEQDRIGQFYDKNTEQLKGIYRQGLLYGLTPSGQQYLKKLQSKRHRIFRWFGSNRVLIGWLVGLIGLIASVLTILAHLLWKTKRWKPCSPLIASRTESFRSWCCCGI